MIILDGKKLSQKIFDELKHTIAEMGKQPRLAVVVVGENPVVQKFIAQKKKNAEAIGIDLRVYPFPDSISTNELRERMREIVHEKHNTGVIVQLPLPRQINTQYILNAVVPEKDVDVLSSRAVGNFATGKSLVMPPVAGAVKAFFEEYAIEYHNKYVVVVGAGKLVGRPMALWLLNEEVTFSSVHAGTNTPQEFIKNADIVISGVGKPRFISGEMVREGVVAIDVGTSESEGKIAGDFDFNSVSMKASYITPVPGGVGPVAVAMLLKNLITLARQR